MSSFEVNRAMIERWEESGLSLRAFGAKEEIPYSRLLYWRKKLRPDATRSKRGVASKQRPKPELVPVKVIAEDKASVLVAAQLTVRLPNGVAIDVPSGFEQQELRRVVDVLVSC